jgi:DNA mismatch endonuclease (patch repair protein)
MMQKGKKHTRKAIKKMRLAHKGAKPWNKGKTGIYSEETKKKMGVKPIGFTGPNLGKKFSAETRKKLSLAHKGAPAWNKGKTGIYSEEVRKKMSNAQKKLYANGYQSPSKGLKRSAETKRKLSLAKKGKPAWNKGKTGIYSEEVRNRIRDTLKKLYASGYQAPAKGLKRSAETRKRMSLAKKGMPAWNKGIPLAESSKEKIRKARLHQIFPVKDTKPEKELQKILNDKGIKFEKHKPILGQPDIFIEPNICIFLDGDYWHANPKDFVNKGKLYPGFKKDDHIIGNLSAKDKWARDKKITHLLKKKGYNVIRFWQSELENYREKCLQKMYSILSFSSLLPS